MFNPDDLIQLSALQHYAFCPRQCALIYVEQVWTENRLNAEGRIMHERVHEEGSETRGDVRIERGVSLRSLEMGIIGKADVIEYHRQPDGTWQAFPVEYKRGKPKPDDSDKIQLCAQAMCLEEMPARISLLRRDAPARDCDTRRGPARSGAQGRPGNACLLRARAYAARQAIESLQLLFACRCLSTAVTGQRVACCHLYQAAA